VGEFGAKLSNDYLIYDTLFTYGVNVGKPGCTIPTGGLRWIATIPPVVPELWPLANPTEGAAFTTVANWNAYGGVEYEGERYGQKDEEFMRLRDLPRLTRQRLELALSGAPDEIVEELRSAGWSVRDAGREASTNLQTYRSYIRNSRGELSAAKHAYVKTRSGWFSDRSVCYLAAGLPVVLQGTGYTDWLPTGRGVVPFSTVEEAAQAIERVNGDYVAQRKAARELAEGVFSYKVVLPKLLEVALGTTFATRSGN
jgi:hypothetical protein